METHPTHHFHIAKAAALVGLHPETLRRLNNRGLLPAKRNWRGHRVFMLRDLLKLKSDRERLQG
jgi:DNA-binding transcriptional MerR regulator